MKNLDIIKQVLLDQAQELKQLADQLGVDGKPLDNRQKALIRNAFVPQLREITDELIFAFVAGDEGHTAEAFVQLDDRIGIIHQL